MLRAHRFTLNPHARAFVQHNTQYNYRNYYDRSALEREREKKNDTARTWLCVDQLVALGGISDTG